MKKLGEKLKQLVESEAPAFGIFLVHNTVSPTGLFRFYMDSEEVLSMNVLTDFTRHISTLIDEGNFGEGAFTFEISSPGADAPLKDKRQFNKHIGRRFEFTLENETVIGKLESIDGDQFQILQEIKEKGKKKIEFQPSALNFNDIKEAIIIISFK
jgi:ribosome maturation factor RimP